jgi:hypothetical protein
MANIANATLLTDAVEKGVEIIAEQNGDLIASSPL